MFFHFALAQGVLDRLAASFAPSKGGDQEEEIRQDKHFPRQKEKNLALPTMYVVIHFNVIEGEIAWLNAMG